MFVEQFVMAYKIEQDRIRALLPEGFVSLRPVLRINTEIRKSNTVMHSPVDNSADKENLYIEFNAPAENGDKRGWINIANWDSHKDKVSFVRDDKKVIIESDFLSLQYQGIGIEGGCPAEGDNSGCFYSTETGFEFRAAEEISANKEFCDCRFAWTFNNGDARGVSTGKTLPAYWEENSRVYPKQAMTAENAAAIPCMQVLGSYVVRFER